MARQLIKPGDTDRLVNKKVTANLIELGLLPSHHDHRPDFVRSPRAAAALLDELLAVLSGPKFTGAARNFRSFAREANARFTAAYAALERIVISDFQNGVHSVRGAAKTYNDLWVAPINHLVLTGGVGLVQDYSGAGSASGTATASAELLSAVEPQLGYSGIIDITPAWDPAQQAADSFYATFGFRAFDPSNNSLAFDIEVSKGIQHAQAYGGNPPVANAPNPLVSGSLNRAAFTVTGTELSISLNGGEVATTPNAFDASAVNKVIVFVYQSPNSPFSIILRKVQLLRAVDRSFLRAFSSLPT